MKFSFFRSSLNGIFNEDLGFPLTSGRTLTIYLVGSLNWGLAPSHRITQRGPFQEGDSDIDYRLDPRIISLPIVVPASTPDEHFESRNALMQWFKPGNDNCSFKVEYNIGPGTTQYRNIDVKVVGGLSFDTDSKDYNIRTVVQLRAADPTWSDEFGYEYQLTSTVFGTPTPYPKPYPVPYGADSVNNVYTISYEGTWISYPVLTATGPLTDLTIVDALGHTIRFDTPIPASTYVSIDLGYNKKTVIDQDGVNRFAWLSIDSDLTNFALFPSPFILDGQNTLSVSATGTDGGSLVTINYIPRYIGV